MIKENTEKNYTSSEAYDLFSHNMNSLNNDLQHAQYEELTKSPVNTFDAIPESSFPKYSKNVGLESKSLEKNFEEDFDDIFPTESKTEITKMSGIAKLQMNRKTERSDKISSKVHTLSSCNDAVLKRNYKKK